MPRKMAEVLAKANEAKERSMEQAERNQTMREQEIEKAALEAARKADEREQARAEAKKAKTERAKQRKAEASKPKQPTYQPGDGRTHATGKTRLSVEREGGCVCGCGQMPEKKRSRFIPGHDARMYKLAKAYSGKLGTEQMMAARETITDRQKAYLKGRNLI
jgi:hypothetical protein